jgi:ribosomal protein S18 acetylase RimI-like enzyme
MMVLLRKLLSDDTPKSDYNYLVDAVLPVMTLPGTLRPLNPLRDLLAVADLIELCFHGTIDAEGRSYLYDLRRSSRSSGLAEWAARTSDMAGLPLSGFVWEDSGRIVGNVSLIPFNRRGSRVTLIANIAVHPDYRRRGIARQLTQRALLAAQERSGPEVWLHVRDDNPGAISLYEQLGWREKARRTTWRIAPDQPLEPASPQMRVSNRPAQDWARESQWFERTYPQAIAWYYPSFWDSFRPGLWSSVQRFLGDLTLREWSAYEGGRLGGVLVAQLIPGRGQHLWAAVPPTAGDDALHALLAQAQHDLSPRNPLTFEYSAYEGAEAIRRAGFSPYRTLIWMKAGS